MLVFTQKANEELTSILAGLIAFRIGDATDAALTTEHAYRIFDDIADHFATIPNLVYHQLNKFRNTEQWGQYVYSYRRNHTNWYAFYDKTEDGYIVRHITNNWMLVLP